MAALAQCLGQGPQALADPTVAGRRIARNLAPNQFLQVVVEGRIRFGQFFAPTTFFADPVRRRIGESGFEFPPGLGEGVVVDAGDFDQSGDPAAPDLEGEQSHDPTPLGFVEAGEKGFELGAPQRVAQPRGRLFSHRNLDRGPFSFHTS